MAAMDASCSTIDSPMLDRYFASYVAEGVVPAVAHRFGKAGLVEQHSTPSIDSLLPQIERSLAVIERLRARVGTEMCLIGVGGVTISNGTLNVAAESVAAKRATVRVS